jgi:2-polyprenyl-6-hydroxyphenyl methylase/3-demethylubiquinone-9 3-methyltransferase
LAAALERSGLYLGEIVGLGPRAKIPTVLLSFIRARLGRITYGELSRRLDAGRVRSTAVSYICFATKAEKLAA